MTAGDPQASVSIEWLDAPSSKPAHAPECAVARVCDTKAQVPALGVGDLVLACRAPGDGPIRHLPATACVPLPGSLPTERARAVAPLALSLWIWDAAALEPGERAVFVAGSFDDGMLAAVAAWRSARDPIRLQQGDAAGPALPGVIDVMVRGPDRTGAELAAMLRAAPGVVTALTTGRSDALDLILESNPMWARIVLATDVADPATIDFYGNVHRKGCRLVSVPGATREMLDPVWIGSAGQHISRAARILQCDRLARAVLT